MAISTVNETTNPEAQTPLLHGDDAVDSNADYKHCAKGSRLGGWRSAGFVLGQNIFYLERVAFRGVESNFINYLTGPLGESMAIAAGNANLWTGLGALLPVFGALLADSFLGIYEQIS
ncbi:unnamed protein product [Coffea canephora]|uniref:Uncharacterized protein n=1 Tax=Coffea canephora TaxID=49390 RepID=A0A068UR08_COFCA|nr:unnamed protein product [Coffea canephora]